MLYPILIMLMLILRLSEGAILASGNLPLQIFCYAVFFCSALFVGLKTVELAHTDDLR